MKKIAIISDSTGCTPVNILEENNIYVSYLMIIFKDKSYQEFKDINPEEFIELSKKQEELPTTSQPSPGRTIELYEQILAKGYDEIIHITVSSGLSGSYQSAASCADMVDANKIHVFDSKTVAYPQGAMAVEAAKLAKQGASVSEILNVLEEMKKNSKMIAGIYNLTNLKKGGRLSNAQAALGSLLNIKPVCEVQEDGTLQAVEKIRTFKKVINALIDRAKNANLTDEYELSILHMGNPEGAEAVREGVSNFYPNLKIHILPLSLVISVHAGEGAVAIGWIKKQSK